MDYEKGLDQLKEYARDKSWLQELRIYESRLRENLHSEKLYGTSEQVRSDRARIVAQLNHLAHEQLGISFNDLCLTASPCIQATAPTSSHLQETSAPLRRSGAFICYSHKDEHYLNELRTHLAYYVRTGVVNYWDDTKILPGAKWHEEIQVALQDAKVAILLISAHFFDSDFIVQNELPLLLDAAEHQRITIFCVILRPCLFTDTALAQFQAINNPSIPLSTMSYAKREKIWVKVAELVRERLQTSG